MDHSIGMDHFKRPSKRMILPRLLGKMTLSARIDHVKRPSKCMILPDLLGKAELLRKLFSLRGD